MSELAMSLSEPSVAQHPSPLNLAPKSMRFWLMAHKVAAGFDASPLKNKGATSRDDAGAFLFTVPDSSMDDAGIMQGEKVVVDRSVAPEHGRLVIAKLNGEFTLKRLFQFNGRLELRSENEAQAALRIPADEAVQLWGVVVGVIRNYTR